MLAWALNIDFAGSSVVELLWTKQDDSMTEWSVQSDEATIWTKQ